MESKGKLTDISRDWETGKFRLTFTVDRDISGEIEEIEKKDLRVRAVVWREKRTLRANAFYWQILSKVADATGQTNTAVHNQLLAEYGQIEFIDGEMTTVILKDSIDWREVVWAHLRPTTAVRVLDDGKLYRVYIVMRGSRTYDKKEFARLVNGLIREAEQCGIATLTPSEIERMIQLDPKIKEHHDN